MARVRLAVRGSWRSWWYDPVPLDRLHLFRAVIYLYVPLDVLSSRWVANHGLLPSSWYQPLLVGRLLHIPAPTAPSMAATTVALCVLGPLAALGRGRRWAGPLVFLLYFYWSFVAFTYGKVDHDRVALLTALAVLPTVAWQGHHRDERATWALGMVKLSFVLTYFLAGVTKMVVAGPAWITSTTLERAIVRRGTMFGDPLLDLPLFVLYAIQFLIVAFELTSPLMLLRNRLGRAYVAGAVAFHFFSLVGITIYFRSHLICVIAFLPLERLASRLPAWVTGGGRERPADATVAPLRSPG